MTFYNLILTEIRQNTI